MGNVGDKAAARFFHAFGWRHVPVAGNMPDELAVAIIHGRHQHIGLVDSAIFALDLYLRFPHGAVQ